MDRLRLMWSILTGGDKPTLLKHERRLNRLEARVSDLEAFRSLARDRE